MTIHQLYKISVFGDFVDITPSPENMVLLLKEFENDKMVTSLFQELPQIPPIGVLTVEISSSFIQNPPSQQRIALVTTDGQEKIAIGSKRIDYEIITNESNGLSSEHFVEYNTRMCKALNLLLEKFNKRSWRLALNTQSIVNITETEQVECFRKFSNPISLYKDIIPAEWSTRLLTRQTVEIEGESDALNIITILSKSQFSKIVGEEIMIMDGFGIELDINTVPENVANRFTGSCIQSFTTSALTIWNEIWGDLF
jgi:hypothetical protein